MGVGEWELCWGLLCLKKKGTEGPWRWRQRKEREGETPESPERHEALHTWEAHGVPAQAAAHTYCCH